MSDRPVFVLHEHDRPRHHFDLRLEEEGVLEPGLADRMRALAGLRNRLVHLYEEIDDRMVQQFLGDGLADLDSFARAMARLAEG